MTSGLGQRAMRGVVVTLLGRWGNTIIMLVSSVVLARLLTPSDFGIVAMVTAVSGFVVIFQDFGLSSAAVRARDLTPPQQMTIYLLNVLMGLAIAVVVFLLAAPLASFYHAPEVANVTRAVSLTFLFASLGGQPQANLLRDLRFGAITLTHLGIGILQFVVTVALALFGLTYWSLVIGNLVWSLSGAVVLFSLSRIRLCRPAPFREVRELVTQGAQITVIQATTYLSGRLDVVAVGRFHGTGETGLYNRASQVVGLVETQIMAAVSSVALTVLSKLQDEHERFQSALERAVSVMSHVLTPAFTILSLVAVPAVTMVYGSQWAAAGTLLVVLALAGTIRGFFVLIEVAATAIGQMKRQIVAAVATQVATAGVLFAASAHSVFAVAVAYVCATFVTVIVSGWWIARGTFIRVGGVLNAFSRPFAAWSFAYLVARLVVGVDEGAAWPRALLAVGVEVAVAAAIIAVSRPLRTEVRVLSQLVWRAARRQRDEEVL
ncbi:lipopolysaccharide biosynthesis protein [Gordonia hankookensis]|uniref:Lipopolysaccharide biosynthesis protein n=1 Tax=Gordonia hankookensis TaxID=589403 RepID=A0ABR7WB09_9ACTN|nr:lipopolysaccharide biosynthesis protein [Gordonia hankookensis]MBD1319037.1 lipopolysaccharide biosynthesis protein [Gordonia hankookensis]